MAKKSGLRLRYDSPVTLTFVLASALILFLDTFFLKGYLTSNIFICHGNKSLGSMNAFDYKNALDYLRLFCHIFGSLGWEPLLINSTFILLLGPVLEERYGSLIFLLMIVTTSLVSGVLNACAVPLFTTGATPVVFMMICLAGITAFAKKDIPLSWIIVFILYTALKLVTSYKSLNTEAASFTALKGFQKINFMDFLTSNLNTFTSLAAGITGSLFGFLVSPKKRTASKNASESEKKSVKPAKASKKFKSSKNSNSSSEKTETYNSWSSSPAQSGSDETVIGTIDL